MQTASEDGGWRCECIAELGPMHRWIISVWLTGRWALRQSGRLSVASRSNASASSRTLDTRQHASSRVLQANTLPLRPWLSLSASQPLPLVVMSAESAQLLAAMRSGCFSPDFEQVREKHTMAISEARGCSEWMAQSSCIRRMRKLSLTRAAFRVVVISLAVALCSRCSTWLGCWVAQLLQQHRLPPQRAVRPQSPPRRHRPPSRRTRTCAPCAGCRRWCAGCEGGACCALTRVVAACIHCDHALRRAKPSAPSAAAPSEVQRRHADSCSRRHLRRSSELFRLLLRFLGRVRLDVSLLLQAR